jgi:hypothetical protein
MVAFSAKRTVARANVKSTLRLPEEVARLVDCMMLRA